MSKTITLSDKNFEVEVLKSDLPILVDFWAPWCGPCKMMSPVLDDLSEQFDGKMMWKTWITQNWLANTTFKVSQI